MKTLMENWNKFINEEEQNVKIPSQLRGVRVPKLDGKRFYDITELVKYGYLRLERSGGPEQFGKKHESDFTRDVYFMYSDYTDKDEPFPAQEIKDLARKFSSAEPIIQAIAYDVANAAGHEATSMDIPGPYQRKADHTKIFDTLQFLNDILK